MKILKHSKKQKNLKGKCNNCECEVSCTPSETKILVDRDTQPGMATQYVMCPECGTDFLWVK